MLIDNKKSHLAYGNTNKKHLLIGPKQIREDVWLPTGAGKTVIGVKAIELVNLLP